MNELSNKQLNEIAEAERWLARFDSPLPSPACLESVRRAIRSELRVATASPAVLRWQSWHGALAAAAVLVFCVTIGWRSFTGMPPGAGNRDLAATLPLWPHQTEADALAVADIEAGLAELEASPSAAADTDLYKALEDLLSEPSDSGGGPTGASSIAPARHQTDGLLKSAIS